MTVTYTAKVANCGKLGGFVKLLFRWRGSIYKLMWPDLIIFLSFYFSCSMAYRLLLDSSQQRMFEKVAIYCEKYGTLIPVSFVLGFYVSLVVGRWWQQYTSIPWIDTLAIWINSNIQGSGEKERLLRRTLMRYTCLSITQCFTMISPRVKKRFPTLEHFVDAGLLLENEKAIIQDIVTSIPPYQTHWIPLVWATAIVTRARTEGKIKNDSVVKALIDEMNKIKDQCNLLLSFDRISVPLVYTQVVTLAVYTYFFSCIMGRQWVRKEDSSTSSGKSGSFGVEDLDLVVPVFTILQFFFYMGWLKVAETLINPFGDDDDDFELNWMVDRHLQVSYLIVDEMHQETPDLLKDQYWEEIIPSDLPHTIASDQYNNEPPESSTDNIIVASDDAELIRPSRISLDKAGLPGTPRSRRQSTRSRFSSVRSNTSDNSVRTNKSSKNSISRLSLFRRLLSKDRDRPEYSCDVFGSSLNVKDTIQELDETNLTIVSSRGDTIKKPTVQEIFNRAEAQPLIPDENSTTSNLSMSLPIPIPKPPTTTLQSSSSLDEVLVQMDQTDSHLGEVEGRPSSDPQVEIKEVELLLEDPTNPKIKITDDQGHKHNPT